MSDSISGVIMDTDEKLMSIADILGIDHVFSFKNYLFVDKNALLSIPSKVSDPLYLYCNENTTEAERDYIVSKVIIDGEYKGLTIKMHGFYRIKGDETNFDLEII
jgi:hypothetical protein